MPQDGMKVAQISYQPLNLENFAHPLSQMQQKYDETVTAYEDSDFGISGLSPDSIRSSELSKKIEDERDEVLEKLKTTKDYRKAAKSLKKLNKYYNEEAEIYGIRAQRATFEESDKVMKERLKKNDITETEYKTWKNYTLSKYRDQGGYNYDKETGSGNPIHIPFLEKNIEQDIYKVLDATAKGAPASSIAELRELKDQFGMSEGQWKIITEEKPKEKLAGELFAWFSQNKEFEKYFDNRAMYEWFEKRSRDPEFGTQVLGNELSFLDRTKAEVEKLSSKQITTEEKKAALERIEKNREGIIEAASNAESNGKFDEFAESLFRSNYARNTLRSLTESVADVYDYYKFDQSTKGYQEKVGASGAKTRNVIDNNGKINTRIVSPEIGERGQILGGTGSSNTEFIKETEGKSVELNAKIYEKLNEEYGTEYDDDNTKESAKAKATSSVLVDSYEHYSSQYTSIEDEIEKIDKELEDATGGKKKKLAADRLNLVKKKSNLELDEYYSFAVIENVFQEAADNDELPLRLKVELDEGGLEGLSKYIRDYEEKVDEILLESLPEEEASDRNYPSHIEIESAKRRAEEELGYLREDGESLSGAYLRIVKKFSDEVNIKYSPVIKEIPLSDGFSDYTDGEIDVYAEDLIKLNTGDLSAFKVVDFNATVGTIDNIYDNVDIKINTDLYNLKNPTYAGGTTSGGDNKIIFRVARDKMDINEWIREIKGPAITSPEHAKLLRRINEVSQKGNGILNDTNLDNMVREIITRQKNNPQNVYLMLDGNSADIVRGSNKTLISTVKEGLVTRNTTLVNNTVETNATISLASNTDNRRDYNEMSATVRRLWDTKNTKESLPQSPHTYSDNLDGTHTGNAIMYRYSEEHGSPVAYIFSRTINSETGELMDGGMKNIETIVLDDANPVTLKKIAIFYGAGNPSERIYDGTNSFVPAFQTDLLFNDLR